MQIEISGETCIKVEVKDEEEIWDDLEDIEINPHFIKSWWKMLFASFFDSEIFSLFYKICYNVKVIKEGYHEAKVFTDDDAIFRN